MTLLTERVILGLFAMSLDLMVGYTRLVSFGHAAAYGLGAYASGYMLLQHRHAAAVRGVARRAADRRRRDRRRLGVHAGDRRLVLDADARLRPAALCHRLQVDLGDRRLGRPGRHSAHAPGPFGITLLTSKTGFYYFALACLVGAFLLCRALVRSPFGAVLRGIRENEAKTMALGYNTRLYKIAVVAIAYALGGLAGALYAPFAGFANTELLFWLLSGQVLIMVIVGGSGTLIGPILGAAFFMLMEHQLCSYTEAWALFFGLVFIAFVLFAPAGHLGTGDGGCDARRPQRQPRRADRGAARARRPDATLRRPGRRRPGRHAGRGGEVRAVIGPNGAGKTTLFNLDHRHGQADRGQRAVRRRRRSPACRAHRSASAAYREPSSSPRCFPRCRRARMRGWRRRRAIRGAGSRSAAHASSTRRAGAGDAALEQLGLDARRRPAGRPARRTATSGCSRSPWRWRSSRSVLLLDEPTQGLSVEETAQAVETLARFLDRRRG